MTQEESGWENYYQKTQGRTPRKVLLDTLDIIEKDRPRESRNAVDLGCGAGIETAILLEHGWDVLAIDSDPSGIKRLIDKVSDEHRPRLQTQVAKFEDVSLRETELVHASLSLPFCHPNHFPALWGKIVDAIQPGGRFAGHFFGVRDSWANEPDMTFLTKEQVRALFENFVIESFHEMDEDSSATSGPKHWHKFTVIARTM
jgi:tellurite methyltransferase